MEITFIRHVMKNGTPCPNSLRLEREARASGLWANLSQIVTRTQKACSDKDEPAILVTGENGEPHLYNDFGELDSAIYQTTDTEMPLACW